MAGSACVAQGMACRIISCCQAPMSSMPSRNASRGAMLPCRARSRRDSRIRAVTAPEDCNEEECAPTKEVGKISLEWVAEERNKVTGTYPPLARTTRAYTGYVEKDTAGQTNVYAVEPAVYVADSPVASGSAGFSSEGSENTLAISFGLGLIAVAGAASVLINVGKGGPVGGTDYSGPPLSYYIQKFSPPGAVEALAPALEAPEVAVQAYGGVKDQNSAYAATLPELS